MIEKGDSLYLDACSGSRHPLPQLHCVICAPQFGHIRFQAAHRCAQAEHPLDELLIALQSTQFAWMLCVCGIHGGWSLLVVV